MVWARDASKLSKELEETGKYLKILDFFAKKRSFAPYRLHGLLLEIWSKYNHTTAAMNIHQFFSHTLAYRIGKLVFSLKPVDRSATKYRRIKVDQKNELGSFFVRKRCSKARYLS